MSPLYRFALLVAFFFIGGMNCGRLSIGFVPNWLMTILALANFVFGIILFIDLLYVIKAKKNGM